MWNCFKDLNLDSGQNTARTPSETQWRKWEDKILYSTAKKIRFMYSQKWNTLSRSQHLCICDRFISYHDRPTYFAAPKKADRSWEYISRSQIHAWERGHSGTFLEIFFSSFRYSVFAVIVQYVDLQGEYRQVCCRLLEIFSVTPDKNICIVFIFAIKNTTGF